MTTVSRRTVVVVVVVVVVSRTDRSVRVTEVFGEGFPRIRGGSGGFPPSPCI